MTSRQTTPVRRIDALHLASPSAYVAPSHTPAPSARPVTPAAADRGETLFLYKGCAGCHGLRAEGGNVAPKIAHTALPYWAVLAQVRLPKWVHRMPAFGPEMVSDDEVQDIYAFLQTITAR
ncbi:MAG TPA: cytochrome c [Candidatus Limnocylindria bacterium]